jgi:hypothetical protein
MNKLIAIGLGVAIWAIITPLYGNPATVIGVSVLLWKLAYEVLEEVTA